MERYDSDLRLVVEADAIGQDGFKVTRARDFQDVRKTAALKPDNDSTDSLQKTTATFGSYRVVGWRRNVHYSVEVERVLAGGPAGCRTSGR